MKLKTFKEGVSGGTDRGEENKLYAITAAAVRQKRPVMFR
jgi:hypothetical protein